VSGGIHSVSCVSVYNILIVAKFVKMDLLAIRLGARKEDYMHTEFEGKIF
jgi:hypothetical protein